VPFAWCFANDDDWTGDNALTHTDPILVVPNGLCYNPTTENGASASSSCTLDSTSGDICQACGNQFVDEEGGPDDVFCMCCGLLRGGVMVGAQSTHSRQYSPEMCRVQSQLQEQYAEIKEKQEALDRAKGANDFTKCTELHQSIMKAEDELECTRAKAKEQARREAAEQTQREAEAQAWQDDAQREEVVLREALQEQYAEIKEKQEALDRAKGANDFTKCTELHQSILRLQDELEYTRTKAEEQAGKDVNPGTVRFGYAVLQKATDNFNEAHNLLGRGGCCRVFKGSVSGQIAAIKVFNETGGAWDDKQIQTEIGMLCRTRHPHINKLLAVSFDGPCRCLILEYMNGGALDDRLSKMDFPVLQWHDRLHILLHVARGLVYMHSLNPPVVHRDVKCGNVLLAFAESSQSLIAKVSDFGKKLSGIIHRIESYLYTIRSARMYRN
jgi:hypothetical protein